MYLSYFKNKKGFTIIEALIVIGIIAIILGVVLPSFKSMRENQVLKSAVEDVAAAIDKARSDSLSSVDSEEHGIHFESSQVVIFAGITYSAGDSANIPISIYSPATISNISLSGGGSDVYFDRLSGEPSKTGTVTLTLNGVSKIITIGATGAVSVN